MDYSINSADFHGLAQNSFVVLVVPQGRRESRPAIHRRFKEAKQEQMWRVPEGRLNSLFFIRLFCRPSGTLKTILIVPSAPGDESPGYYQPPLRGSC
jgi:hypothetical protein